MAVLSYREGLELVESYVKTHSIYVLKNPENGEVFYVMAKYVYNKETIEKWKDAYLKHKAAKAYIDSKREEKLYTQKELEEAERAAFKESRLTHPIVGFKHDKYEDYKKSKK